MAQGNDSNSRRDRITITRTRGTGRGKVEVSLSDGSSFFILKDLQRSLGLDEDTVWSRDSLSEIKRRAERLEAEQKSLSLLSTANHSRNGLRLKLLKRGFSSDAQQYSICRMEELGYLDDDEYASQWVASRIQRHPEGRNAMLAGLQRRGISRLTAEQCISRLVDDEVEMDCARRRIQKLSDVTHAKLTPRLVSGGFSRQTIKRVLNELQEPSDFPHQ